MANPHVAIKASVDASGVVSGVDASKKSIASLGDAAKKTGADTSAAFSGIANSSKSTAEQIERTTRQMQQSIERATAAAKAGGSGTAAYYEAIANQRGLNLDVLKPYISQLDQAQKAAKEAATATTGMEAALQKVGLTGTQAAVAMAAVGAALVVAAEAARKVVSVFTDSVKFLAELDDAAEKAGSSVEEMSKLLGTAAESGKSLDTLTTLVTQLQKGILGAEQGSSKAAIAFKALGLDLSSFDDGAKALKAFAVALNQYEDGANKTQIALAALNRIGAENIPLLKDIAAAGDQQATVTAKQAAEAEKLEKAWNRMKYESSLAHAQFVSEWIPTLTRLIETFNLARKAGLDFFQSLKAAVTGGGGDPTSAIAAKEKEIAALRETLKDREKSTGLKAMIEALHPSDTAKLIRGAEAELAVLQKQLALKQAMEKIDHASVMDARYGSGYGEKAQAPKLNIAGGGKAAKDASDAYDNLISSIRAKIAASDAELEAGEKLTDSQRLELELRKQIDDVVRKEGAGRQAEVEALKTQAVLRAESVEAARKEAEAAIYRTKAIADARRIWDAGQGAENSPVRGYLALRGITRQNLPDLPTCLPAIVIA